MKDLHQEKLKQYARLLVEVGANIQKNQTLAIMCPVELAYFARLCASAAYDAGCRYVEVLWRDDFLTREKYLRADDSVFDEVPEWVRHLYNDYSDGSAAFLSIYASDPENLRGVDPDRLQRSAKANGEATLAFRTGQMNGAFQWCIASVPIPSWSGKVFPGSQNAEQELWDAIFAAVRIDGRSDPVELWKKHNAETLRRREKLNAYQFTELRYKNSLGTDLTVGLPEDHRWAGGDEETKAGVHFIANMPTEEIFAAPHREKVNGVVYASKPLVKDGNIIDGFGMELKNGRIIRVWADKGLDILESAIAVDEGSRYFGEVALVPYDSPISNSGILFYNTLFDENASCHFAFGEAYPCVEGGSDMTAEEKLAHGLNYSISHVDFMVGTRDLSIVGVTADGREIPVFVDGNFAI